MKSDHTTAWRHWTERPGLIRHKPPFMASMQPLAHNLNSPEALGCDCGSLQAPGIGVVWACAVTPKGCHWWPTCPDIAERQRLRGATPWRVTQSSVIAQEAYCLLYTSDAADE